MTKKTGQKKRKRLTITLSTMYPILFGLGLLTVGIAWLLHEPSLWSNGLIKYQKAECSDFLNIQYQNIENYEIGKRVIIQQKVEMCMNRRYIEQFDKVFKEFCIPNDVAKNIRWIGVFVILGNCGTFVFTLHKVSF